MSATEFYEIHKKNGGDLAMWDGNVQEITQPKREPNPSLKRLNYKFVNLINVIDAEIVANKNNN